MTPARRRHTTHFTFLLTVAGVVVSTTALSAHDFWLVPNALMFTAVGGIEVLGQSGSRFPTSGGLTQPAAVADARIVGRSSDEKITDLSVSGKSLMLKHKPSAAGQYVVAVSLAARNARTTPERLQRYIALEGAPELAAQYEKDGKYPKSDSVTQTSAKFAKTIIEVGDKGPRAFDNALGHALELIPLDDPSAAKVGGTVRVKLLFRGMPLAGVHLRAGWGSPDAIHAEPPAGPPAKPDQVVQTGPDGIAAVAIAEAGLWNVRTLYAAAMQGMPEHWQVYFATMVFNAGGANAGAATAQSAARPERTPPDTVLRGEQIVVAGAVRALFAAAERKDVAALDTLYAGDSLTVVEGAGINRGWVDYRDNHLGPELKQFANFRYRPYEIQVRVAGPLAWAIFQYAIAADAGERKVDAVGRGTAILERRGTKWVVRHTQTTSRARRPTDPPMP